MLLGNSRNPSGTGANSRCLRGLLQPFGKTQKPMALMRHHGQQRLQSVQPDFLRSRATFSSQRAEQILATMTLQIESSVQPSAGLSLQSQTSMKLSISCKCMETPSWCPQTATAIAKESAIWEIIVTIAICIDMGLGHRILDAIAARLGIPNEGHLTISACV